MFVDGESCPAAAVLSLPVVVCRVSPCATAGVVSVCLFVESAEQVADVAFVYGQFLVVGEFAYLAPPTVRELNTRSWPAAGLFGMGHGV